MIGKGKSIAHTKASIMYGWNQEKKAEVIYRQHISGGDPSEIAEEFRFTQKFNTRCRKNTLSFVLSPTIEDGKNLTPKGLNLICKKFIRELNLGDRQAMGFVHRDKKHTHIHLYVNRIDFNGKAYKDSFLGKRCQMAAEIVAKEMNLKTVKEVQADKMEKLSGIRMEIKKLHEEVLKKSRPKNFDDYIKGMKSKGVIVHPTINKAGNLQGFRFEYRGHNLKGSEVHRSMSGGNIGKVIYKNPIKAKTISKEKKINLGGKTVGLNPHLLVHISNNMVKRKISEGLNIEIR